MLLKLLQYNDTVQLGLSFDTPSLYEFNTAARPFVL